jgi:serine/threonine-protein phosphatase 2A activator
MYEVIVTLHSPCQVIPLKYTQAEVLGKRVVVQHLPLGGLMEWDTHVDQRHAPSMSRDAPATADTRAPWAQPR